MSSVYSSTSIDPSRSIQHQHLNARATPNPGKWIPQPQSTEHLRSSPRADPIQIAQTTMPIVGNLAVRPTINVRGLISSCFLPALLQPPCRPARPMRDSIGPMQLVPEQTTADL